MTRRGAGRRQQQNKQMEPGWPLQIPTVAPARDPILGPVGHELGIQTCQSWPQLHHQPPFYPGQVAAALRSRHGGTRAQPCLRS